MQRREERRIASERDDELSDNENEKLAQVPRRAGGRQATVTSD